MVRDAIGVILRDELSHQATLQASIDPTLASQLNALSVFAERFHAVDHQKMPAIDIFFFNADFDNKDHTGTKRASVQFYLDILTASNATATDSADRISSLNGQRLAMLVHDILEDPAYTTLGFPRTNGIVQRTLVTNIKRTEESYNPDGRGIMLYRLIFDVILTENREDVSPAIPLDQINTRVRIAETNLGYEYQFIAQTP